MVEARRPKFCGVCGRPLHSSSRVLGYDVYSGDPLAEDKLSCPATATSRIIPFRTVSAGHASYVLSENSKQWEAN